LIHISTDYVFDGLKKTPYTENDQPNPNGVYAKSKFEGEKLVHEIYPSATICRTSWLFGKNGRNFVRTILDIARQGKEMIQVVEDQMGSPTYTIDLAKCLAQLVELDTPSLLHICNDGYCSWFEYARKILDLGGYSNVVTKPVTTREFGRPAPRPGYSVLDCSRLSKLLGSKLRHWEPALIDLLEELI